MITYFGYFVSCLTVVLTKCRGVSFLSFLIFTDLVLYRFVINSNFDFTQFPFILHAVSQCTMCTICVCTLFVFNFLVKYFPFWDILLLFSNSIQFSVSHKCPKWFLQINGHMKQPFKCISAHMHRAYMWVRARTHHTIVIQTLQYFQCCKYIFRLNVIPFGYDFFRLLPTSRVKQKRRNQENRTKIFL